MYPLRQRVPKYTVASLDATLNRSATDIWALFGVTVAPNHNITCARQ